MNSMLLKLRDSFILSIPLLVMLLLAVVTWWLVLIAPEGPSTSKIKILRDEPDIIMNDFLVERFDRTGFLRSIMKGTQAERVPIKNEINVEQLDLMTTEVAVHNQNDQPVIDSPGIEFFKITAIADRSTLFLTDSLIELNDNAFVTRQPYGDIGDTNKIEFRGDELKIMLANDGRLYSDKPVEISQEGTQFTANAMTYDYATNTLQMLGRVIGNTDQFQQR